MSPSWIETLTLRRGGEPAMGIALRPGHVDIAQIGAADSGARSTQAQRIELPTLDFRGAAEGAPKEALTRCFRDLATSLDSGYRRVFISLPDPLARVTVLRFGHIPRRARDFGEIVAWRMRKEFDVDPSAAVCRWQRLGADGQSELVYVVALDLSWLQTVNCACDTAGLTLSGLDIDSRFAFNSLLEQDPDLRGSGVLINVSEDDFTFLVWDEQKRLRIVRSRWRDSVVREGLSSSIELVVAELERMLLAYMYGLDHPALTQIYMMAPPKEIDRLTDELHRRVALPVRTAQSTLQGAHGDPVEDFRAWAVALGQ